MRIIYFSLKLIALLILLVFCVKNMQPATFVWGPGDRAVELPFALFLFIFFCAGALFGALALSGNLIRSHLGARKANAKIKKLERELSKAQGDLSEKETYIKQNVDRAVTGKEAEEADQEARALLGGKKGGIVP